MPSLGVGLPTLILNPPVGPTITVAPPAATGLLVVPVEGPQGPQGVSGDVAAGGVEYVQSLPVGTASFTHSLPRRASVTLRDYATGRVFDADITEATLGTVVVTFTAPLAFTITLA